MKFSVKHNFGRICQFSEIETFRRGYLILTELCPDHDAVRSPVWCPGTWTPGSSASHPVGSFELRAWALWNPSTLSCYQPGLPGLPAAGTAESAEYFHGVHAPRNLCCEDHGGQSLIPFPREFKQRGVSFWINPKSYFKALSVKWNAPSLPVS